jgi:hypothetical protein
VRGWIVVYSLFGTGSLSALALGSSSWGVKCLLGVVCILTALGMITGAVRGRA